MLKRWNAWPGGARRTAAGIAAVVLVQVLAWVLFVPAADWLARHDVGTVTGSLRETALDDARGQLLTLGAGLFAAGALVFTARNFTLSRRTLMLTEQGQVTDRYTRAIEQLGSRETDVRIGGIYALERIATDSARDHPTVMEVLTAFIREHSRTPPEGRPERWPLPDVQAAITVIRRRDTQRDTRPPDLDGADLARAKLDSAPLARADLSGTDLSSSNLRHAILTGAGLAAVLLRDAKLDDADFRYADLTGADLTRADLTGAKLRESILHGADLTGAKLKNAKLWGAGLRHAKLAAADLSFADFTNADLHDADLTSANCTATKFDGADLIGAKLHGAELSVADFTNAFLSEDRSPADLAGMRLSDLANALLRHADLTGADLTGAKLAGADLIQAKLSGADLTAADLTGADLTGADLTGADLTGAKWPADLPAPKGWELDTSSGLLNRA